MIYPNAAWHPTPNHGGPIVAPVLGVVLHVEQGSEAGTVGWFCNPKSQASSHFGVGADGHVDQFVDTDNRSWAQAAGNATYWSIETEGYANQPLTDAQVHAIANLYRWLRGLPIAGFDYVLAEAPGQRGFGWHGMGGAAWGGHLDCPGDLRKAQRATILQLAHPSAPPPSGGLDMAQVIGALPSPNGGAWVAAADGGVFAYHGAPFHGSYPGLPPEDRQGQRTFVDFLPRDDGVADGYELVGNDGTHYRFP